LQLLYYCAQKTTIKNKLKINIYNNQKKKLKKNLVIKCNQIDLDNKYN